MKNHLTEQELIEYQFKLASDIQTEEASKHLESCAQCRKNLERLKRKFSSLDLLREDVKVSEDLISKVVEQTKKPKVISVWKPKWIGAAAVLLLGLTLLVANLTIYPMSGQM